MSALKLEIGPSRGAKTLWLEQKTVNPATDADVFTFRLLDCPAAVLELAGEVKRRRAPLGDLERALQRVHTADFSPEAPKAFDRHRLIVRCELHDDERLIGLQRLERNDSALWVRLRASPEQVDAVRYESHYRVVTRSFSLDAVDDAAFERFVAERTAAINDEFEDTLRWIAYTLYPEFAAMVHRLEAMNDLHDPWQQYSARGRVPGLEWQHGASYREQRLHALSLMYSRLHGLRQETMNDAGA